MTEPPRIARLPHDKHGRPVPWFVAWVDGLPDFRLIRPGAVGIAATSRICWTCGIVFTRQEPRAFLVGPMCIVNLVSAEPPSHYDCAVYSATHCPFLTTPNMVRRDRHLPEGTSDPPGTMIKRNPGVAAIVVTKYNSTSYHREQGGLLFGIGQPQWVEWYARGRQATRSEVLDSILTGMPALVDICAGDERQLAQLDTQHAAALRLVPQ